MKHLILALSFMFIAGCKSGEVRKNIEAELWLIDPSDSTLYRVVKKDGVEQEEFYSIPKNPKLMKRFACMIDTDRKKWLDVIEKSCTCQ